MAVSGTSDRSPSYTENIWNLSDFMMRHVRQIQIFSSAGSRDYSGLVPAGDVCIKVPRYCFLGDSNNRAFRMQYRILSGKVNNSIRNRYVIEEKSCVKLKRRGELETF